ncbi:group 4 capsule polysaccharide lipoprotein GfcB/YjbF [Sphaerotilus hippei]|uniref:Group 4 capsule polysaccharide lipoprotein GfcB/YjbF n=1 Tax=Sphaerotilus hippei TaxID=744406 RepID=A0A318H3X0_9BURK|nr:group 4 capsule polysaccharide lipoprotein GfcB/YjbF [Sphaerotilus hippei]
MSLRARPTCRVLLGAAVLALTLTGCQVTPSPTWQTVQSFARWPGRADPPPVLNPDYEYLALTLRASTVYLALGYRSESVVPAVAPSGTPVVLEHWYSARRELLALEDGRLHQVVGAPVEWRAQRVTGRPSWSALVEPGAAPVAWTRSRDEMPAYRYGVVDLIRTRRIDPAKDPMPDEVPADLARGVTSEVVWVHDDVRSTRADGQPWRHAQWFALTQAQGRWRVLWSHQCLGPDWCVQLRPVAPVSPPPAG